MLQTNFTNRLASRAAKWGIAPGDRISDHSVLGVQNQNEAAARAFPESVEKTVGSGLSESLKRVLAAQEAGELTEVEAALGVEMLREICEGLNELATGQLRILGRHNPSPNVQLMRLRADDGDVYSVTTRRTKDDFGQPRIAFKQIADNGVSIPNSEQMHVRLDHSEEFGAAVDIQFGWGELNEKIHGVETGPEGQPILTYHGTKVPRHHFQQHLGPGLSDPIQFTDTVDSFINGPIALL